MHTLRIHCTGRPGAALKPITGSCPASAWDADDLTIAVWLDAGAMTSGVPDAFDITTIATLRLECRADVDTEAMLFTAKEVTSLTACTHAAFKNGTGEHAEFVMTAANMNVGAAVSSVWVSITADLDDGTRHTFAAGELKIEHSGDSDALGPVDDPVQPFAQYAFKTLVVSGQTDIVADTVDDTLTIVAGDNITLTTSGDTLTITGEAGGGGVTAQHPSDVVDTSIAGLTANSTTKNVYSTQNHATPSYVRSTTCWGADLDLTCASPWNSNNAGLWAGTAITPRHIVMAFHACVAATSTIRFITADNTIVTRTLSATQRVGSTDICIGLLDSDLPATITPAKLLPDDWSRWMSVNGTACFFLSQTEELRVADISLINNTNVNIAAPSDAQRLTFYTVPDANDSGNPVMTSIGGDTVLLFCFEGNDNGPTLIANNRAGVLSAISTLGAHGHAPEDAVFPAGIDAAALRNPGALVLDAGQTTTGVFATARLGTGGTGGTTRFLREDGTFTTVSGAGLGDVSSSANLTDNNLVRGDGGAKGVQTSGWILDDTGSLSFTTAVANAEPFLVEVTDSLAKAVQGRATADSWAVAGQADGAGGIALVGWPTHESAYALSLMNPAGWHTYFTSDAGVDRTWQYPNDPASPNIVASRGWVSGTFTGSTNITTLGTISTGTWSGTTIAVAKGGTGLTALGTALQVLRTNAGGTAMEWAAAGTGTVTTVSVVTANGVSGSVATATTTPAITLTLGAITPTTVNGLTITTTTGTLTIANGVTLTASNNITLATDGTGTRSLNIGAGGTLGTAAFTASSAYAQVANNLSDVTASTARTNLGLVIGTDVQAYHATLAAVVAGTYTGATSITTLGTVATGTWSATTIAVDKGGTGRTSHTAYAVLCGGTDTTSQQQSIASVGTAGQVLKSAGAGALPAFADDHYTVQATFDGGGSAISAGKLKGFYTAPMAGTIDGWSITVDTGTLTFKVWKIATGTAKPTVANVINTSGVAISSGTHVSSATVSDFTSTAVAAGDIFAFEITAVSGATEGTVAIKIKKS